ncbi:sensor histidine kinase [Streptomyces sp. NBC_01497]|uniref:sensor histidine kinase n=1 Tax=Streptomyces sp. NBC_01497 TaxID=2903885 RepID=UPI002E311FF7|nr:ATP-binding protein [Streptomyces sp. NBC_01497]
MVRKESPPGAAGSEASRLWLLPAVATAAVAALIGYLVPSSARTLVVVLGVVAVVVTAAVGGVAARRGRRIKELTATVAAQRTALSQQENATVRLAGVLLPEAMERLRKGEFQEDVLASLTAGYGLESGLTAEFQAAHRAVLTSVLDAVSAEEDLRESAQRAFVNVARRIQAFVHQQALELRQMEDRHGQVPEVFGDLLELDHGNSLIGRLAATIAVLGGARPGHQWRKPVPLYSVLRGAMGQIIPYQRVDLHSVSEVAVEGPGVGPLIHALAELLDNATRYSPPHTRVHLTTVEVQSGIAIEIEDGGVSMSEEARKRAERMLHQAQQGIDVADLGETPRLGLAAVGKLAQANGFTVSLRASAYGGVRAVLVVPQKLITTTTSVSGLARAHGIGTVSGPREETPESARPTSRPASGPAYVEDESDIGPEVPRANNGLPQRRRRAQISTPPPPSEKTSTESEPAAQPGEWFAAFSSAVSGDPSQHNTKPGSTGKGEQQ